jgi:hypothetical protein
MFRATKAAYGYPQNYSDYYNETSVMQFLFSLLRIKGLYMFRALLAHRQEGLHNTSSTPTLVAAN